MESKEAAEQTLRESAEARFFLETMFETTPNAIVVSDLAGEILIFNHTGRLMFGYGEDDPLPTQTMMLFKSEAEESAILAQQFSDTTKSERLCVRESGEVFPALVYVSTIKGPDGGAKGLLYVVNDITRSENFREMIMRLDRISIRGEMAEDIVHEINNYITVIQGNAELLSLLIHKGDKEKIEKRLNTILDNVKRISTFMSGMMSFAPNDIEFEPENLNQLIHNLIAFLRTQKRLHNVEIDLNLSPDIGIQEFSAAMFQQLLVNLIYNSADALAGAELERSGKIRIETMVKDSSSILLTVSDNGPGVAEEHLEAMFEESFSTKRKGHGIGLITCAQIVKSHNGQIRYTGSTTTGARFEIELPIIRSMSKSSVSMQAHNQTLKVNNSPNSL
ncbi:MAG: PAS domain S-box protein [candidate division Zixibacteria bacterium]|nr:PAS domain S-box protein [candidate division Zixibacteria bacterium]